MPRTLRLSFSPSGSSAGTPSGPLQPTADYRAAERSNRLRPIVKGLPALGASGDWHLRRGKSQLYIGELGQEFDRNNPVATHMLDCMEDNILQDTNFFLNPKTGDRVADRELKDRWLEETADKNKFDLSGEYSFDRLTRFVLRQLDAAGDVFLVFTEDGPIELLEHHRCQSPTNQESYNPNLIDGVEMDDNRRRLAYWFTTETISPLSGRTPQLNQMRRVPAYYEDGQDRLPNVLHIRDTNRYTLTRGLSLFAPVFDYLAIHDELQFQQLLKSQLANLFLVKRERNEHFNASSYSKRDKSGVEHDEDRELDRILSTLYPGAELKGAIGEKLELTSPNVPNESWFQHMKLVLRIVGLAWGLPYVLMLLDTSDTTFHGYRGALNEARNMFRRKGKDFAGQVHTPIYENRLHRWCDEDRSGALNRLREESRRPLSKVKLFRHEWTRPGWASVQPVDDAAAMLINQSNSFSSPRRDAQSVDAEWPTLSQEIVADRYLHASRGFAAARKLLEKHQIQVTDEALERWATKLAPLSLPERTQLSLSMSSQTAPTAGATKQPGASADE